MNINCHSINSFNRLNDGQSCYVIPDSNMCFNKYNVYINGMISADSKAINNLNMISVNDANNVLIYNGSDYSENLGFFSKCKYLIKDVFNAIRGKFSSSQGVKAEKSVQSTVDFLKNSLNTYSNVTINAHSQGAIILKNALYILKDTLTAKEWDILRNNLTINILGAPVTDFPKDLNITEWKTHQDFITYFQALDRFSLDKDNRDDALLANTINCNDLTCENFKDNHKLIVLDAKGHSFSTYVDAKNYYQYING